MLHGLWFDVYKVFLENKETGFVSLKNEIKCQKLRIINT